MKNEQFGNSEQLKSKAAVQWYLITNEHQNTLSPKNQKILMAMTPKEKAEELVIKFQQSRDAEDYNDVRDIHAAIRCALIAVDELIACSVSYDIYNATWASQEKYWQEVKQEIEAL